MREHEPFEWKPVDKLKRKYEDSLKIMLGGVLPARQRVVLEFAREEEVVGYGDNQQYEKEKTKIRRLVIGSCKLLDNKLEKAGTYEFIPGVSLILNNDLFNYRKMRSTSNATTSRETWGLVKNSWLNSLSTTLSPTHCSKTSLPSRVSVNGWKAPGS